MDPAKLDAVLFGKLAHLSFTVQSFALGLALIDKWKHQSALQPPVSSCTQLILLFANSHNNTEHTQAPLLIYRLFCKNSHPSLNLVTAVLDCLAKLNCYAYMLPIFDDFAKYSLRPNGTCIGWFIIASEKVSDMDFGMKVFELMKTHSMKHAVKYGMLIKTLCSKGKLQDALTVLKYLMSKCIQPTSRSFCSLLNACAQSENLSDGELVVTKIMQSGISMEDNILLTTMMHMYVKCQRSHKAIQLWDRFCEHRKNIDCQLYSVVLIACGDAVALKKGKSIHMHMKNSGIKQDIQLGISLITMYAKCGNMAGAAEIFKTLQHETDHQKVTWTAMLGAYARLGWGKEAIDFFNQMCSKGIKPDHVTLGTLLNACSHAGLVDKVLSYFHSMEKDFGIVPNTAHQNCVVDAFGRKGQLKKAEEFAEQMKSSDVITWTALLGACRAHRDVFRAEKAAIRALRHDPKLDAAYVLLSNIYAAEKRWEDLARIRKQMEEYGIKKVAGRSWIEIQGETHSFVVSDKSHRQSAAIYAKLKEIFQVLKEAGYVPDTNFVLHDVDEESKEHLLCEHSEKLAIAYGLIMLPPEESIVVAKNLRVCGDCHQATKFISKVYKRTIIVRDANRFHIFENGECSCRDFW